RGLLLTGLLFCLFGLLVLWLAQFIIGTNPASADGFDSNNAFIDYILNDLHPFFKYLALIGLFAALVSTADAELLVIGLMLSKELNRWEINRNLEPKDTRYGVIIIGLVLGLVGYFLRDYLVDIFYALLNLLMITGPIAWLTLFQRGKSNLLNVAILGSWGVFLYLLSSGNLANGYYPLLIPLPILLCLFISKGEGKSSVNVK
ncbi:MAG: hypothetical protein MRY72_00965, partial [Aquisalinus sp.]|nr:hypothetical protein [Aquisalinus sp.]